MSTLSITVKSEQLQAALIQKTVLGTNKNKEGAQALIQFFRDLVGGQQAGTVDVQTGSAHPVAASATLTLVSAIATDTITIGGVIFTATSTPTTELHWEIDGASDTLDAVSLAAAINAHSTVKQVVTATSATNVVTVTAKLKGVAGNFIPISSQDATITASAAFLGAGTGGATDAATTYSLGL